MNKKNQKSKKYDWHATASSEGTLGLSVYFPNEKATKNAKEEALSATLVEAHKYMLSKGYLLPNARFLSSSDVAKEYGFTRQYWEKLLKEGKIPYKETSAGRITTDLWVKGYLDNREKVNKYVRNMNKVISRIEKEGRKSGNVECPNCKENRFDYAVNVNNINGICRAGCGFRIHTTN